MSRRRRIPERANHERWLVSYADFITLLFAFFTTLYAISTVDQRKAGKLVLSMMQALHVDFFPDQDPATGPAAPIAARAGGPDASAVERARKAEEARREAERQARLARLAEEMEEVVVMSDLRGKVTVRKEHRGVVLSLAEAGFFESGSAALQAGGRQALVLLAGRVGERPDLQISVEGHTDDVPVRGGHFASNWELSTARATFVVAFLIDQGIAARRLSAAGYAEHRPVADNTIAEGRAKNRRVDLVLQEPAESEPAPVPLPDPAAAGGPPARSTP